MSKMRGSATRKRNILASGKKNGGHPDIVSSPKKKRFSSASDVKSVGTPPSKTASVPPKPNKVTPNSKHNRTTDKKDGARRALEMSASLTSSTPTKPSPLASSVMESDPIKGAFGKLASEAIHIQSNTRSVYKIVNKQTGSVGGNGSFGAIYGELTVGSMQKMVNLMKKYTEFSASSRFIDVGSGLGKPSLHVAQDPGVEFSYGIEMERVRWMLGMSNLNEVLKAAYGQQYAGEQLHEEGMIKHRCMFDHGNVMEAESFNPFTHVYMFSIGFPPKLWKRLSTMFNRSESPYLICYQAPRIIIERYGFLVELVKQAPTSMHGSSEGHMGYLYRRKGYDSCNATLDKQEVACDSLFEKAWNLASGSLEGVQGYVNTQVQEQYFCGRRTRSSGIVMCAESVEEDTDSEEEN